MALSSELLSGFTGFIVTVLVFSYLLGDNPLFRAAVHIFVGAAAGYVAAITWEQVIMPSLIQPFVTSALTGDTLQTGLYLLPILGSTLLLGKVVPQFSKVGQLPIAFLVGVGAGVAIGGAILGTLIPQINAMLNGFDVGSAVAQNINPAFMLLNGTLMLLGVIGTLAYFHFSARQKRDGSTSRNVFINLLTWIGRIYIAITFGVLFAGVYMAALTALIERMDTIRRFFTLFYRSF